MKAKISWDRYFLAIAHVVASRSTCIKRQIGALVVKDNRILATGYNGTPAGILDCVDGGCARCIDSTIPSGTRLDECWCSHAEENAIVQCAYFGVSTKGTTLYTTLSPCVQCAKLILQAGIETVYYGGTYSQNSEGLLRQGGVKQYSLA